MSEQNVHLAECALEHSDDWSIVDYPTVISGAEPKAAIETHHTTWLFTAETPPNHTIDEKQPAAEYSTDSVRLARNLSRNIQLPSPVRQYRSILRVCNDLQSIIRETECKSKIGSGRRGLNVLKTSKIALLGEMIRLSDETSFHPPLNRECAYSDGGSTISDASSNAPTVLGVYFDSMRHRNVILEQLHNLELTVAGLPSTIATAGSDAELSAEDLAKRLKIESLHAALVIAEEEAEYQRRLCSVDGIDPERFRYRRKPPRRKNSTTVLPRHSGTLAISRPGMLFELDGNGDDALTEDVTQPPVGLRDGVIDWLHSSMNADLEGF